MNTIKIDNYLAPMNPYLSPLKEMEEGSVTLAAKERLYVPSGAEKSPRLTDRAIPLTNYERQIDAAGNVAKALDWGVFGGVIGLQGVVFIDELFKFNIIKNSFLNGLPHALKALSRPLGGFFFSMGIIESIFEVVNLKRVSKLLHRLEQKEDPLTHLTGLKKRYFTLSEKEGHKIANYIDEKFPNLPIFVKARCFVRIAEKTLHIKYESLERRITPGLAKGVSKQIDGLIEGLQSPLSDVRAHAQVESKTLLDSVTRQVKNKIVIHILGLLSLSCTIISMSGLFLGVTAAAFFVVLGAGAMLLMAAQFLGRKVLLDKETSQFFSHFNELKEAA